MTLSVQLRHSFGGFALDAAFTAAPGVTALFGRSGAGKTTIVNAVAGLLRPDAGRIAVNDAVLLDTAARVFLPPHRRRIGYVFQDARLFPHLTVRQNLLYGRWFAGGTGADFGRICEMLGIGALLDRRPARLSGGEKSRVALGRAMLSNPQFLLMDEPLAALDEERKAEILPYLELLRDETRLPILYVSHSAAEVARLATTVVLIEAGRVTAAGPAAETLAGRAALQSLPAQEAAALITARVAGAEDDGLIRVETAGGPLFLPAPAAPVGVSLRLRIPARDVMLALSRPEGISALNILAVAVEALEEQDGGVIVRLRLGRETLLSRITARSARLMRLAPGLPLYAVVKSVALAPAAITRARD